MRAVPDGYEAAYAHGAVYVARVEVLNSLYTVIADSSTFLVDDGSIEVDRSASFRRRLDNLVIVDINGTLVPNEADDMFSVTSGNLIKVYTGYRIRGVDYLFSQGVFMLEGADAEDSLRGITITLSAFDLSRKLARNKYTRPFPITNNENTVDAAKRILNDRIPGLAIISTSTTFTTPYAVLDVEADPNDEVSELMKSIGYEFFFNPDGLPVLQPEPDPDDSTFPTTWTYEGGSSGTLLRVNRASSNENVPNYIVVTGQSTYNITPARGASWDDDTSSPTYAGNPESDPVVPPGPYGLVPDFVKDPRVSTASQALASAQGRLLKNKGKTEMTNVWIVPNPAHVEGDVFRAVRPTTGLDTRLVIEKMTIPLKATGAPEMPLVTRKRKVA